MNSSSIYIHVPWCRRRCPYCDFYFVVGKPKENFIDALLREWTHRKHNYLNEPAKSIYFGGGTPSLLEPQKIAYVINFFIKEKALAHDAEITIEANPEDLLTDYAMQLSKTAVNRISLGVQSFDDTILAFLGRKHSSAMAHMAIENLFSAGYHNISVDMIIGVVKEKDEQIIDSLRFLHERGIPHVSAYLLTIEERTKFYHLIKQARIEEPREDAQAHIYRLVQNELINLGYIQYDISSYARPGFFSRHNQIYWAAKNYIGLGPGAHSMRILPDGGSERLHNQSDLREWLKDSHTQNFLIDRLIPQEALKESLAIGLRNLSMGITPCILAKQHQAKVPAAFFAIVEKYNALKWLDECDGAIKITREGALFADSIMRDIICC
jgi:oxygen-independent coproporphyrinogen-3 oxidase